MTSMLEYLASLRKHGHTPETIGNVRIGRTVYAAGYFTSAERPLSPGCRAYDEGQRTVPPERRIALMPAYRTDWVTVRSAGPRPPLLPPSYVWRHAVYTDQDGAEWYVAGWNECAGALWLHPVGTFDIDAGRPRSDKPYPRVAMVQTGPSEPFATSLALASPEVLARIESDTSQ